MPQIKFSKAVRQAITLEMERDERVFAAGEDITHGGTMRLYYGLAQKFPGRIVDTPISETAIAGLGLGAALMGMRPIIDFNIMDFTMVAMDEIVNQIAKYRHLTAGKCTVPLVMHASGGATDGAAAQHSQSLEALYCHIPGLKVVAPSTPADAKGLMASAIRCDDPVMFVDYMSLCDTKGEVPEGEYLVPIGKADRVREGDDLTIVSYGSTMPVVVHAADALSEEGINADVLDLRTLVPLDKEALLSSVRRTGRLVVVHEAVKRGGYGAEVVATVAEEAFDSLRAPIVRLGAPWAQIPFSPPLREEYYVSQEDVCAAARKVVGR